MPDLRLIVFHEHDLPPKWDGERVAWEPWEDEMLTSLRFCEPVEDRTCDQCGLIDAHRKQAVGRFPDSDHPHVWRLRVSRCECGHDAAYDILTGELWDLEPDDYTDAGSHEYSPTLF